MASRRPLVVEEAVARIEQREIFPTGMKSWALEAMPTQWKERSFFSAGVTQAEFLELAKDRATEITSGKLDRATARLELKQLLASLDYKPEAGTEGTLQDLRTDRRLNLILDTQVQMAREFGNWQVGQRPAILRAFPAKELVRRAARNEPRDWPKIWVENGGTLIEGRMVALKDDDIWRKISRFGLPYPPYDYYSGMGDKDVKRREARALGILKQGPPPLPDRGDMNADLAAKPRRKPSGKLLEALVALGVSVGGDGKMSLGQGIRDLVASLRG